MYSPKPIAEHFLEKEDGHEVYFAEYGNPAGLPIISVHGGPGSQSKAKHAARMNLEKYRVILFDQRGCGKSTHEDLLKENTSQKLASDMERIRKKLDIDSWVVTGGSWGSALSLFYAQTYPERVKALLLSAIFLGDELSLDWFGGEVGVSSLFTDVWEHRNSQLEKVPVNPTSAKEMNEKLHSLSGDELNAYVADVINWEGNLMSANANVQYLRGEDITDSDITYAKVFLHYESNRFFMEDEQLLKNVEKIKTIPLAIIHGRHDVLCPFKRAWDLYKNHGNAQIVALPQSNHAFSADGEVAKYYFFQTFLEQKGIR